MAAGYGQTFAAANVSQSTYGGSTNNLGFPGMGGVTYLAYPSTPPGNRFDVNGNILSSSQNPQLIPGTPSYTGNPGYYGGNNGQGNTGSGAAASNTAGWMNATQ
jgi:hypothetical protein